MEKNSKIYVAGHTGMVGSALVRRLKAKGFNNIICRTLEELDLTDQQAVVNFFRTEKPEYVFLAAAKVGGIQANNIYRAQFIYENLMIQNNIIHQSYLNGVTKLLFLGSSCIYPRNAPQPLKEEYLLTGELEPTNEPYAVAKIAGIKMCESYYRQYGCDYISVMPTNLYGPNDNYNLETSHVLPAILRKVHLAHCLETGDWKGIKKDLSKRPIGEINADSTEDEILSLLKRHGITNEDPDPHHPSSVTLWGTGQVYREFMHVDDMAAACVMIMEEEYRAWDLWNNSRFINIGIGVDQTIEELAQTVKRIVGFKGVLIFDNSHNDGMFKKMLDVSKLSSLGFKPEFSLEKGIEDIYRKYLE